MVAGGSAGIGRSVSRLRNSPRKSRGKEGDHKSEDIMVAYRMRGTGKQVSRLSSVRIFGILVSSLFVSFAGPLRAQEPNPRIAAVERGLRFQVQPRDRRVQNFSIQDRLEFYDVPGVSIAVLDAGRIAWAKGYGAADATTGRPVLPETLFQAASISKPIAAMAALRLVQDGVLELDAPVNRYLKKWKVPDNRFTREQPVTLRHLLTHTGGLTVHGFPGYAVGDSVATTVEVLDGSGPANTPPVQVDTFPGSLWRYSGGGYTVLQLLLEDVTGKPFPELMREMVLDPAGMPLSSYVQPLPPGRAGYAATGHLLDGTPVEGKWHIYPELAAAGLWTNPTELARLALDVQASLRGEPGHILSQEMTRAQLTPGLGSYGLGFGVQGEGASARFSHGGSNHGFKAQFMAFVEGGRGVFVMTNGDRGSNLAWEVVLAVARIYGWPEPRYQEVILADLSRETLQAIAGRYRIQEPRLEILVSLEGDHLRVKVEAPTEVGDPEAVGESQVWAIYPTAEDFYIDLTDGTRFRVERDEDGSVVAIQILGGPRAVRVE